MVPSSIVQVIDEHDEFDHYLINPKHSSSKSILVAEVEVEEDGDHHQEDTVQQHPNHLSNGLCWDDVIIEKFLGVGGFNCVSLARIPKWEKENDDDNDGNKENDIEKQNGPVTLSKATTSSRLVGTTTTTATSPQKYYAIKCLKNSIAYNQHDSTKKKEKYVQGLKDLINEGRLLSQLQHPHILQCHGTGSGASATAGGYFLVLECMETTLDHLLVVEWKQKKTTLIPSLSQRLHTIALGIAKAMEYLHAEHHVIYRDLKPKNIGIDKNGTVKLFDFGIAHKLVKDEKFVEGCIGSLRYMAPETLLRKHCQYESDIYSYGVLLWELITLEKPYSNIIESNSSNIQLLTARQFQQHVAMEGLRPGVIPKTTTTKGHEERIPPSLRRWIEHSWERSPQRRPNFTQITRVLETNVCRKEVQLEKKQKKRKQKEMSGTPLPTTGTDLTRKIDSWFKKNVTISFSGRKVSATS